MDEKQKENLHKNLEASRRGNQSSRFLEDGVTYKKSDLPSKGFNKMMTNRGLSKEQVSNLKDSSDGKMQVRHAKQGEKFVVTHGKDRPSGIFVSESSLGNTPQERINRGALPPSNTAQYETKVELAKDQNLVYRKIAPQSQFVQDDPSHLARDGGGEQVITDGGYNNGAVRNRDSKFPATKKCDYALKAQQFGKAKSEGSTHSANHGNSNTKSTGIKR